MNIFAYKPAEEWCTDVLFSQDMYIGSDKTDGAQPFSMDRGDFKDLGWMALNAPDGLAVVDSDGVIRLVNDALNSLTGYDGQELNGQLIEVLVPQAVRPRHVGLRAGAVKEIYSRGMGSPLTVELLRKDGSTIPVDVALRTIEVDGVMRVVVAVRDDAERRRLVIAELETRLRADQIEHSALLAARRFQAGFDNSPNAMFLTNSSGMISDVNATLCTLVGRPSSAIVGLDWRSLIHREVGDTKHDRALDLMMPPADSGIVMQIAKYGDGFATVLMSWALTDPQDPAPDAVFHLLDITERASAVAARDAQVKVLSGLVRRSDLASQLAEIKKLVEEQIPDSSCLIYRKEGDELVCVTCEGAPVSYLEPCGRLPVALYSTPCGHAVAAGVATFVVYDSLDLDWLHVRRLGKSLGFKATSSQLLHDHQGQIIGTLALHLRSSTSLASHDEDILKLAVELTEVCLGQSLLDQHRLEAQQSLRFQSRLLNAVGQAVVASNLEGQIVYWNTAAEQLFGWSNAEALGRAQEILIPNLDLLPKESGSLSVDLDANSAPVEFWAFHRDGSKTAALGTRTSVYGDTGELVGEITVTTDISEIHRTRLEMIHRANHDSLTNLPNRQMLEEALSQEDGDFALFVLALDRFDAITDSRGHAMGDEVLIAVARRLHAWAGTENLAARLDGGTFAVICRSDGAFEEYGQALLATFNEPFTIAGRAQFLSASVGASYVSAGAKSSDVLTEATAAVHAGKEHAGGTLKVFDSTMRNVAEIRLEAEEELRRALRDDQFRVVYQPQVDLHTGRVTGVEALLRWERPGEGLVGPAAFLQVAEDSGLILPIGRWILEQACEDAAGWERAGLAINVSVNFSARQLVQPNWIEFVSSALQHSNLSSELLCLEVTESVLLEDMSEIADSLVSLRAMGVGLHIDDFGTGYSSLTYLRRLPATGIKIDRSFVMGMTANIEDRAIVTAIISLAQVLNLEVIAEGVEQAAEADMLLELGCSKAQGYLWTPALIREDLLIWIETWEGSQ